MRSSPRPAAGLPFRLLVVLVVLAASAVEAGHEPTFYPSFYPQEIRIDAVEPASAAALLQKNALHAYVGGDPFAGRSLPAGIGSVESLGSYLVISFNPASRPSGDGGTRCAGAARLIASFGATRGDYVFHPYPVTPYDADYLQHFDLVEAARKRYRANSEEAPGGVPLKVRTRGEVARGLIGPRRPSGQEWDATVEEVDVGALVSAMRTSPNGWAGPPWIKAGWFHAYLLLASAVGNRSVRQAIDATYHRLVTGGYGTLTERLNLERALVTLLTRGCERVVVGYTVKREAFTSDYSAGIENIAFDSLTGLDSAVFIRTVKLKDFPWNGWLRLGTAGKASAPWNPVAGFTDGFGRLIWAGLGDPALLPAPYGANWVPNRVTPAPTPSLGSAGVEVPQDALAPEPGSGALRPVGRGKAARARVVYRVLASAFHDGTKMTVADVLYPFIFSFRWGARGAAKGNGYDPVVGEMTALVREWLVGLRIITVDTVSRTLGEDVKLTYEVPVVEVYLKHTLADAGELASVAPPWSTVPWHVVTLMEEAVQGGLGALSEGEARRRGIAWLDLVRDRALTAKLARLVGRFRIQGYVPRPLSRFVTGAEARGRWERLERFHARYGHFLATNGPYRLEKWSPGSATLAVFRDLSYPLGVGAFDRYPIPLKAYASRIVDRGDRVEIQADVERVSKFQRTYEVVREPLGNASAEDGDHQVAVCRYVIVGAHGAALDAGVAPRSEAGGFVLDLAGRLPPGLSTIMIALFVGENSVAPEVRMIEHRT